MSMALMHRLDELEKRIEAVEQDRGKVAKQIKHLQVIWQRFRKREGYPVDAAFDPKIPARPKCLDLYVSLPRPARYR